ncbi:hypothetical protein M441DRAFT_243022 [Trichoderma asperellum CBS 433.97]|uniref:Uncharacterized protein n=1 Tax=Trichoderma asperellum (strain ATCC 204424 / CBS 433.97 / NBRC 101777) TaxID=1042311 RepID=A0A2T3Z2I6_TRIA4|nr:hypothetical protein M441DRAFT_243022 [Trichoderma asperellum CBS 433.97]PTB39017.1 hypothetical protein M441DRAFT_243022 [Trichoderma asperellum CBS 433.97]
MLPAASTWSGPQACTRRLSSMPRICSSARHLALCLSHHHLLRPASTFIYLFFLFACLLEYYILVQGQAARSCSGARRNPCLIACLPPPPALAHALKARALILARQTLVAQTGPSTPSFGVRCRTNHRLQSSAHVSDGPGSVLVQISRYQVSPC